ncbi:MULTISPECIES: IPTL-CTERM sorting domain-containing protein [unclassified Acidovorax]|nr:MULTISPECIES: IPTL-CTERM sorting domain-containing protein [unclassified Acidovorax]
MKKITRNFAYWRAFCFIALFGWLLSNVTSAQAAAHKAPVSEPSSILFIVNNVPDYQQLRDSASASLEVVVLDAKADGLREMADALKDRQQLAAVHLISHGASGALDLGSLTLDRDTLMERSGDLARIRSSLRPDADLLLYGCEVAQGSEGQRFINMLGEATGAHVAASANLTGNALLDGDWLLESLTGPLRSTPLDFPAYRHVLATVAGTFSIAANLDNNSFTVTKFLDSNPNSQFSFPNIEYEIYFANAGNTPTGNVTNFNLGGPGGSMLIFDTGTTVGALIIKSQLNRLFGVSSFRMQDAQGAGSIYTATAYRNGAPGATSQFTADPSGLSSVINLPIAGFRNIDEIRITSDGGIGTPNTLFREGFNTFVFVNPTGNADLTALSASAGSFNSGFDAATTSYTMAVGNATTSTTITPTVDTPGATVTVNGVTVSTGAASGSIALNVGSNTITTVATATDGTTTKTYTITITRAAPPSSNANLSSLALSAGTLSPVFASGTTSYTAGVPFNTTSLTVTPTVADATARVTVNGVTTTSGNASGAIALAVGNNTITTVVTAQDGTTKTYTTTVTRAATSGNAQLGALSLSSGTLAPVFASGTTSYTAGVSNVTTSITVTPTVADATASVTVNGVSTASGNASGAIALAVGANTITVTATAQNGTPLSYTITVTRAASANVNLSALSLSSGTLAPVFAAATTSYTASVSNATTSLTVTPTVADAGASVTVNGVATTSGNASGAIALAVGSNTITTVVTAADGTTTKTYTVTVTRAASSNNDLSALNLSSGTLSPVFASGTTSYVASLAAGFSSITITPTAAANTSSITVNGVAVASGTASGAIPMNPGSNTVTVVVTAQNGATKSYTLNIIRALPSNDADLSTLSLSSGTLSPAFAAGTTSYTASVGNATTSLTVTPTVADPTASVTVNGVATTSGNASGAIALAVGANIVTTIVTAQDGSTTKTYTVTVTRAGSGDANLSALTLSSGTLSPAFASGTTSYTASIAAATASITVTPTANQPNATVTVNGATVASGNPSGAIAMNTGSNTVTVVVTAQNSTTKTYTVTVTRAISTNNDLALLALSSGTLNPVFSAAQQTYTATVPNTTTAITFTPTVADSSASVTVNGVTVASGAASGAIPLNVGANLIIVVVTAQDGSPRSYTVTVTRAVSSNADLSALSLSSGTLSPAFASATINYTATVPSGAASVAITPTAVGGTATVNGVPTASGAASAPIALGFGDTAITVVVTAPDAVTTKTYTVTVTRSRPTTATGNSPAGGGLVTASLAGPAGCGFDRADFIALTGSAASPPPGSISGYTFNQGLFDVVVDGCPNGAAVTVTLTYPQPFPAGGVYMKYGPTPSQNAPHWHVLAGATINGNTVSLAFTDGGSGDDDLVINGTISDPGGVALALAVGGGGAVGIPTLSQWGVLLLSLLVAAAAGLNAWRTQRMGRSFGWQRG